LKFNALINPIYAQYGFEPLITMTSITPRALCSVMTVAFDKDIAKEAQNALNCYDALWKACAEAGYIPYRCGIRSMNKLAAGSEHYWDVVRQLKAAVDPKGIVAPGRYLPTETATPPQPPAPPIPADSMAQAALTVQGGSFVNSR